MRAEKPNLTPIPLQFGVSHVVLHLPASSPPETVWQTFGDDDECNVLIRSILFEDVDSVDVLKGEKKAYNFPLFRRVAVNPSECLRVEIQALRVQPFARIWAGAQHRVVVRRWASVLHALDLIGKITFNEFYLLSSLEFHWSGHIVCCFYLTHVLNLFGRHYSDILFLGTFIFFFFPHKLNTAQP